MIKFKHWLGSTLAGLAAMAALPAAFAQAYPSRPVHIVVPYAPGGGADILARAIGQKLSTIWGQAVIVENRAGAGSSIGTAYVAKMPADGYTLLMASPSHSINQTLYKNLTFDAIKDFAPIVLAASGPLVVVVNPANPAKSIADFIAQARAKPGAVSYASAGIGSSPHLAGELFQMMAKVKMLHTPYKGTGPALTDVMGKQADSMFAPVPAIVELLKGGQLRALGVTSLQPFSALPKVPPIANDLPGYEVLQWWGLAAPAGTPAAIITKVNADVAAVLRSPDMRKAFDTMGADPGGQPPAQFAKLITDEVTKWAEVIKAANVQPE
ncbi:MAG TPA: tripartite tricarboxylate transporter substrate binding protein [Burkholderiales bacterium]|jgi:tripartite-type tricarboxylate transporter receptor subunit TctC